MAGELQSVSLFDFSGGVVNKRTNPLDYPQNSLWEAENIDCSDKYLKTRLGTEECTASAILASGVVERLQQITLTGINKQYLLAQARSSTQCKLYASNTPLPSNTLDFDEIYDLGTTAGKVSIAVLNDRAIITEGVATVPLVFLGGLETDGSDWVTPKQIFCTLNGIDYFDLTDDLTDNDSDSVVTIPALPAEGGLYICFDVATVSGLYFGVSTPNTTTCTMYVDRWYNGAWTSVAISDGTSTGGKTLAKSGVVTWTAVSSDYSSIAEVPGYWFRIRFSLVSGSSNTVYATMSDNTDMDQPSYMGTIVAWHKDSTNMGTFRNGADATVAVGSGTDVTEGSKVVFTDTTVATITNIVGDGTGASGVTLSVDHATASLTGIYRATVENGVLSPNYYLGADGATNANTSYATDIMTTNTTPAPHSVSSNHEASYAGWKAFDQSNTDYCWSVSGNSGWLKIDLGTAIAVNKYYLQAQNVAGDTGYPKDWTLQASNDDASWTTLDTRTSEADPGMNLWGGPYAFSNAIEYRYYKLDVTDSNGAVDLAVGEVRLIESPKVQPTLLQIGRTEDALNADVSTWSHFDSVTITQTTTGSTKIYHLISFDGRVTWKAYVSSAWRTVVQNDMGTWKYHNGSSIVPASSNDEGTALRQAFAVASNKWEKTAIEALTRSAWEKAGGFTGGSTLTIDFAFGLLPTTEYLPQLDKYAIAGVAESTDTLDITATSDLDLVDLKGTIVHWNRGASARKGRFEDEAGNPISIGPGNTEPNIETGLLVEFGDATVTIIGISGDGTDPDAGVTFNTDHADGDVVGIWGLIVSSGSLTIPSTDYTPTHGDENISTNFVNAPMTAYNAPSPLVASSNVSDWNNNNRNFHPWECHDWHYGESHFNTMTPDTWAKIDLGTAKVINKYDFIGGGYSASHNVDHWNLQGSNNDVDWDVLHWEDDYPWPGTAAEGGCWYGQEGSNAGYFTFGNTTAYRYYRFYFHVLSSGVWAGIGCIKLIESVTTAYVPVYGQGAATATGKTIDCTSWDAITGATVTETKAGASAIYYALSFDGRTTYKAFCSSAWRDIAKDDGGTWKYNDSATTTPNWVSGTVNARSATITEAMGIAANRMTGTTLGTITEAQWEGTGGWSSSATDLDFAVGMQADGENLPSFDKIVFSWYQDKTAAEEPTNASTDISNVDMKGTIAKWVKTSTNKGYFATSGDVAVTLGSGKTNENVELGVLVTFADTTTATITSITGDGSGTDGVIISSDIASQNVTSITGIVYSSSKLTVNSYGVADGAYNASTTVCSQVQTSPTTPSPQAVTSSSTYEYLSYKAFNQTNTDAQDCWWSGSGVSAAYITYDFGADQAVAINKYSLTSRKIGSGSYFPSAWTIKGSNNGTSWTTLDTKSGITDPGSDTTNSYTFSNATVYRYYKLDMTASTGTSLAIGDIKLIQSLPTYCESVVYVTTNSDSKATPPAIATISQSTFNATIPAGTDTQVWVSFDSGVTYKVWSSTKWVSVVQLSSGTWQYNTNMTTPSWSNAPLNTKWSALAQTTGMSKATFDAIAEANWAATGGYTVGGSVYLAYKMTGSSSSVPEIESAQFDCVVDATYVVTALSKIAFRGPVQALCNILPSGTGDLCMGFVFYQTSTNKTFDYSVEVGDGAIDTGGTIGAMTSADYLYVGGVEKFTSLQIQMENDAANSAVSTLSGEYWNGLEWKALSISDGTTNGGKTLSQRGEVKWGTPTGWRQNKPINNSQVMGYWIRLTVSATLSSGTSVSGAAITSQPEAIAKHKYACAFSNRLTLANRPDARDQVDVSRKFEEYGFCGSDSVSIRVGGQDAIISAIKSYDQVWLTKLEDWYQVSTDTLSDLQTPRGESAAQAPINNESIALAPIDKYGKSMTSAIADAKNKQGVYFLNHNGAWCFTGAELYKLGEWVTWWESDSDNPKLDMDYLHQAHATFWAFRNWLIWAVPMITGTDIAQTTNNRLIMYDITNGMWLPPADIPAVCLCPARVYQANAPTGMGMNLLLAGGYDGKIYRLFAPAADDDDGAIIDASCETGWLSFGAPHVEKILRTIQIFGTIESGSMTFSVMVDGNGSVAVDNAFTISDMDADTGYTYELNFSNRNIQGRLFKFSMAWSGPGSIFGMQLELGSIRNWASEV